MAPQSDAPKLSPPADFKYISSVLNSELAHWFRQEIDSIETYGARVVEISMTQLRSGERQELIELVDEVAAMSEAERRADAGNTVLALNDLILDFYQVTGEEEDLIYAALGLHAEDAPVVSAKKRRSPTGRRCELGFEHHSSETSAA